MRDLIQLLDVLVESRGLAARKAGEEFVSTTDPDDKIYLDSVEFYPQGGGQFADSDECSTEFEALKKSLRRLDLRMAGTFKSNDLGFGVATFTKPGSGKIAWVKPFREIKADPVQNSWSNKDGIPGYRYNGAGGAKAAAALTPQDILTRTSDLTAEDVVQQIAEKFGRESYLTRLAGAIAWGQDLPMAIPAQDDLDFAAFRDYFCELLHPLALQRGTFKGNAGEAAAAFLGSGGFATCVISYGADKTEGLSDSVMTGPDGKQIKVSSKGGAGAHASARNLVDAVKQLPGKLQRKHAVVINMLERITQAGQAGAPLMLGVEYDIITTKDRTMIESWKNLSLVSLDDVENISMSRKLKKIMTQDRAPQDPNNVNLYYHAIAGVAFKVADHINENTGFSAAAAEILNNGALVQVYTKAKEDGDSWVLQSFDTVWPSKTVAGVKFSAGKTYYSTGIKGNFTFKIVKSGEKDTSDDADSARVPKTKSSAAPNVLTGKNVSVRPRSVRTSTSQDLGRARR